MYIPIYTGYKALKEKLKQSENEIEKLKLQNADLRDEHTENNLKMDKYEELIAEIKLEIPKQHYGSVKDLGNKILTLIKNKELDVSKMY